MRSLVDGLSFFCGLFRGWALGLGGCGIIVLVWVLLDVGGVAAIGVDDVVQSAFFAFCG